MDTVEIKNLLEAQNKTFVDFKAALADAFPCSD